MTLEIRIDFTNNSSGSYNVPGFNRIQAGDMTGPNTQNLNDVAGVPSGVNFIRLSATSPSTNTIGAGGTNGTGDAAWIPGEVNGRGFLVPLGGWLDYQFQGLDPEKVYVVECSGISSSGTNRLLLSRTNGGDELSHNTVQNLSGVNMHAPVAPNAEGELAVSFGGSVESGAYLIAARIYEVEDTSPRFTLTGDLQPGASFTLNYVNFTGVPVSPVTITDSNSNSITVPVTITDNSDGTGTATGTMPALPASGTAQGLLFGNVTVELST